MTFRANFYKKFDGGGNKYNMNSQNFEHNSVSISM